MTIETSRLIFKNCKLTFNDITVYFRNDWTYGLVKNEIPVNGTYEFVQRLEKVFLRTKPPILSGIEDLEIGISLGGLPVEFSDQPEY